MLSPNLDRAALAAEFREGGRVRVENVLDQDYQEIFGIATAGLAAYAGLRLRFDAEPAAQAAR